MQSRARPVDAFEMLVGFNIWLDDDATELRVAWPVGFIQATAAALAT
jgi:hypothetical protein